jgi:hypothetical protein
MLGLDLKNWAKPVASPPMLVLKRRAFFFLEVLTGSLLDTVINIALPMDCSL